MKRRHTDQYEHSQIKMSISNHNDAFIFEYIREKISRASPNPFIRPEEEMHRWRQPPLHNPFGSIDLSRTGDSSLRVVDDMSQGLYHIDQRWIEAGDITRRLDTFEERKGCLKVHAD